MKNLLVGKYLSKNIQINQFFQVFDIKINYALFFYQFEIFFGSIKPIIFLRIAFFLFNFLF
ncbi:hypothetical protein PA0685 [Candidatus Phytoplasma australiense]|uniref:Uncharacterized protein n=2 Tax=Phytoplasma australiense TaxID=59748 RepID=B1VAP6_PHYAS|nr:hypothetical protein SLY_0501 [Strawberry lethal yellows phytoplasma (CPA) str. NZSb11]CAM12019.1 hypothetical protein PA0685 [Candidatus Phytoplasma australiense]